MKRIARESVIVIAIVLVLTVIVLLVAQGRLFPWALARSPFAKPVGDGCFYMCLPGVIVALSIWGYYAERTMMSDLLIVAVNTVLYSTLLILLLSGLHRRRRAPRP